MKIHCHPWHALWCVYGLFSVGLLNVCSGCAWQGEVWLDFAFHCVQCLLCLCVPFPLRLQLKIQLSEVVTAAIPVLV